MEREQGWKLWMFLGGIGCLLGCEQMAPAPSVEQEQVPERAITSQELSSYCRTVCQRAEQCGLEQASQSLPPGLSATVKELRARAERLEQACVSTCQQDSPPAAGERARFGEARACAELPNCQAFAACMDALVVADASDAQ